MNNRLAQLLSEIGVEWSTAQLVANALTAEQARRIERWKEVFALELELYATITQIHRSDFV